MTVIPGRPAATPVIDTAGSPYAKLHPVGVSRVRLHDSFLAPRRQLNCDVTLPGQYRHLEETGRLQNFRRILERSGEPFVGIFFNDSDVYKWLEAVAWTLADGPDAQLEGMVSEVARLIEGAQDQSGYLNTYFTLEREDQRWSDLKDKHELYCAGHFIQAAVAHQRASGSERLLNVARRLADHICEVFGPDRLDLADGHEEIEMALVELYRATGERRYLEQAGYFIGVRGHRKLGADEDNATFNSSYYQDHLPLCEMPKVVGHAVRMVYLMSGVTDLYLETGEPALLEAVVRLWTHMTTRQMYVSGGLGARYEGEAFGEDYELPNARAYTETCAAIGSVMWNQRLLAATGEARYADLLEHTLYNAVLPGWSLDGQTYFYQNPLADEGGHRRRPWFGCACCPPNVARLMASLPGYFYSTSGEGEESAVWVHLYAEGEATLSVSGQELTLRQRTRYPWDGMVRIEVGTAADFTLKLRVPAWAQGATLSVNGEEQPAPEPGKYVSIGRAWRTGDSVELVLSMEVRRVRANPRVLENVGRVAYLRGPLLYALEGVDHPGLDLDELTIPPGASWQADFDPAELGGVVILATQGILAPLPDTLYDDTVHEAWGTQREVPVRAIPYHVWANREAGQLRVWLGNR